MSLSFRRSVRSIDLARAAAAAIAVILAAALLPASPASARAQPLIKTGYFGVSDSQPAGTHPSGWPRASVGTIRLWDAGVAWNQIETSPGVFNFSLLDSIVSTARAKGAKPLLVLGQTPRFHATHPGWVGSYGKGAPTMPKLSAWKRYVRTVAQRYGRTIGYQVWNEPNIRGYWRGTPGQMARLTRAARYEVKKAAPGATLAAPSFPVRLSQQRSWVLRYYRQRTGGHRVAHYVDVVSLNLYPKAAGNPESSMSLLHYMRPRLRSLGVRKQIWNTEINYGLTGHGQNAARISRRRQAAYVARTYVLNIADNVRRVYWYAWDLHGLANTEVTWRNSAGLAPGGKAYKVVQSWLLGGRMRGCSISRGTYSCKVTYRGGVKRIYWNPSRRTSIRAVGSATSVQMVLGKQRKLHGGERLSVNYAPIMVRSKR